MSTPFTGPVRPRADSAAALRPVSVARVTGGFWAARRRTNAEVSVPEGPRRLEEAGNLANLRAAADVGAAPEFSGDFQFQDSDVHKWLEAASWQLADAPDPALAEEVARIVRLVAAAQLENGYLQTYYQLGGGKPWTELGWGHELYCAGHLIQAAVAHHRATGGRELLDVAVRFADHIESVFGPGKQVDAVCGHPEVETALVELYRTTDDRRHLELARYFVERRGHGLLASGADRGHDRDPGPEYWQDHTPVREAQEVTGHAVRQLYLLAGAADLATETGDAELRQALERLWADAVATKTYVTGGMGSRHDWEAFGDSYELPSDRAYTETCAAIASVHFSWRMALLTGETRYSDLVERTLFNGFLGGVGLDGRTWLYVNPLQRRAHAHERPGDQTSRRTPWFRCACCPPNAMRLLAALPHFFASADDGGLQLHQYATGQYAGGGLTVRVATEYPWHGTVTVTVEEASGQERVLSLRVPAWCEQFRLSVNGLPAAELPEHGWLRVRRIFRPGDTVRLELALPVRRTHPHPYVDAVRGCVALERGPLVYCLEGADNGGDLDGVVLDASAAPEVRERPDLLGGVTTVVVPGRRLVTDDGGWWPYRTGSAPARRVDLPVELTAVPYYAWANRDAGAMRVWIPRQH
ncbi:beta-L-arabinofuranosidase domain-containing protein [Streptomyces sp. SID13726]|uniref:glycoside hydrolase family 127 protein n=1 Tax=Streptomyces sp. SID13726 TaxID=2706058 RepID=UPI0013B90225|nr:beta-L-arabinofuranosidase domain-containing protein [Streptomyces sp. SID13726]NEB02895.1 glycoside hydrolase family 127 protein [Streptomyces sp. SID13726]